MADGNAEQSDAGPGRRWPVWSLPEVLAGRPAVRVNQLGYLPHGPKRAVWVTDTVDPAGFVVRGSDGEPVLRGRTQPWADDPEPSSGQHVQVIDFSALRTTGHEFTIMVDGDRSHPFAVDPQLYDGLARDALQVLYLLRSGCPIDDRRAPGYGRPAGHPGDAALPAWSGPDAADLYPGWDCAGRFDVAGGWYDAGDYGKYATSGATALWALLGTLSVIDSAPVAAVSDEALLIEECRWQLDWLLRMQVPDGDPLAGMVFHRVHGTTWSPMPGWPHDDPTTRVLHRPSTSSTAQLAAVAARAAVLLRSHDPAYAERLLTAARTAHDAALRLPVLIAPDDEGRFGGGPYGDPDPSDDLYWADAELWLATGEQTFADRLAASPWHHRPAAEVFDAGGFDNDRVAAMAQLDLAGAAGSSAVGDSCAARVVAAARHLVDLQHRSPWGQPYAPAAGWAWGSNGRILTNLLVLAGAARLTGDPELRAATAAGMDHLLGLNALGQSYVVGYGTDATAHSRTRQFGHDLDPSFPPVPPGALAGGPNSTATPGFPSDPRLDGLPPQLCYLDEPTSETTNDICIRWNAPLVQVATYLSLTGQRGADQPPSRASLA